MSLHWRGHTLPWSGNHHFNKKLQLSSTENDVFLWYNMSGSIISFFIDYSLCDGSLSCWIWLIRWSVAHKKMIKTTQNVLTYNDSDTITSTMSVGLEHATSLISLYEAVFLKPFTFNETLLVFMYVGSLGSCIFSWRWKFVERHLSN